METVEALIRAEENGSLSFGNHRLEQKAKAEDFAHGGDLYKVKTYRDMTKLEKNGMFSYESVPGTSVREFLETEEGVCFFVSGDSDTQITLGLQDGASYDVSIGEEDAGLMRANLGGKLSLSVELARGEEIRITVKRTDR